MKNNELYNLSTKDFQKFEEFRENFLFVTEPPVIEVKGNALNMRWKTEDGSIAYVPLKTVKYSSDSSSLNKLNVEEPMSVYVNDREGLLRTNDLEVGTLSYGMLGDTLTKSVKLPFGKEYFFGYNKSTGTFQKNLNEKFGWIGDVRREVLTKNEFYSELFRRIKTRLIMGYFSVNEARVDDELTGPYLLKNAKREKVMENLDLGLYDVFPFVNVLEKSSSIPEEFYDSISQALFRCAYVLELDVYEIAKLKQNMEADFNNKSKLPSFKDPNNYKKVYIDLKLAKADALFRNHALELYCKQEEKKSKEIFFDATQNHR